MKFHRHKHGIGEVFFTSDHHWGHEGIIEMCGRKFDSLEEMDRTMIERWNAVVGPRDVVWYLGDFAHHCPPDRVRKIWHALRGQKHLVIGNHDKKPTIDLPWTSVQQMVHITVDKQRIHLSHYGQRVWPGQYKGAIHLYGHSHGRLPGNTTTMDVGVDNVGYFPLSLENIREHLSKLDPAPIPDDIDALDDIDIEMISSARVDTDEPYTMSDIPDIPHD